MKRSMSVVEPRIAPPCAWRGARIQRPGRAGRAPANGGAAPRRTPSRSVRDQASDARGGRAGRGGGGRGRARARQRGVRPPHPPPSPPPSPASPPAPPPARRLPAPGRGADAMRDGPLVTAPGGAGGAPRGAGAGGARPRAMGGGEKKGGGRIAPWDGGCGRGGRRARGLAWPLPRARSCARPLRRRWPPNQADVRCAGRAASAGGGGGGASGGLEGKANKCLEVKRTERAMPKNLPLSLAPNRPARPGAQLRLRTQIGGG